MAREGRGEAGQNPASEREVRLHVLLFLKLLSGLDVVILDEAIVLLWLQPSDGPRLVLLPGCALLGRAIHH